MVTLSQGSVIWNAFTKTVCGYCWCRVCAALRYELAGREAISDNACFAHWQVAGRAYHIALFQRLQTMMKLQVLKR